MSEQPPGAPNGEPTEQPPGSHGPSAADDTAKFPAAPLGAAGRPGAEGPQTPPWGQTPPGAQMPQTPPWGQTPPGAQMPQTPPWGQTPPGAQMPQTPPWWAASYGAPPGTGAQDPPYGVPPYGVPPYGVPPYGVPPYGVPPYGVPPYGVPPGPPPGAWAPGTQGGPPPQGSRGSLVRPWRVVGAVLVGAALVALGVGIGFSAWGTTQETSASSPSALPTRPVHPQRPLAPRTTTRVTPGTGSTTAKNEAFLGVEIANTTAAPPPGPTFSTPFSPSTSTGAASTSPAPAGSTSTRAGTPKVQGARVLGVVSTSPAAKAGIVKGDVITGFDTLRVVNPLTLSFDVLHSKVGQSVSVDWATAAGKREHATVTLTTRTVANRSVG